MELREKKLNKQIEKGDAEIRKQTKYINDCMKVQEKPGCFTNDYYPIKNKWRSNIGSRDIKSGSQKTLGINNRNVKPSLTKNLTKPNSNMKKSRAPEYVKNVDFALPGNSVKKIKSVKNCKFLELNTDEFTKQEKLCGINKKKSENLNSYEKRYVDRIQKSNYNQKYSITDNQIDQYNNSNLESEIINDYQNMHPNHQQQFQDINSDYSPIRKNSGEKFVNRNFDQKRYYDETQYTTESQLDKNNLMHTNPGANIYETFNPSVSKHHSQENVDNYYNEDKRKGTSKNKSSQRINRSNNLKKPNSANIKPNTQKSKNNNDKNIFINQNLNENQNPFEYDEKYNNEIAENEAEYQSNEYVDYNEQYMQKNLPEVPEFGESVDPKKSRIQSFVNAKKLREGKIMANINHELQIFDIADLDCEVSIKSNVIDSMKNVHHVSIKNEYESVNSESRHYSNY